MKNNFNFLQIANLIYILKNNLIELKNKNASKQEIIISLEQQTKYLQLIKDVINKKKKLIGIQKKFLVELKKMKEGLNIEE